MASLFQKLQSGLKPDQQNQIWKNLYKTRSSHVPLTYEGLKVGEMNTITVEIQSVENIKVPPNLADRKDLQYAVQPIYTLHSKSKGFFGRSMCGPVHSLDR